MIRHINKEGVARLLESGAVSLEAHIEAVAAAYREYGEGTVRLLGRQSLETDPDPDSPRPRSLKIMGATLMQAGVMGVVATPTGYGRPLDFRIVLSSAVTGKPIAIVEGEVLTYWATASVTAAATRALAREDSRVLGIIGTGSFGFDQPLAISRVRPIEEVRCYSRDPAKREDFARRLSAKLDGVTVRAVASAAEAAEADILTTVTTAHQPVVASADIAGGTHVNAIGMHYPKTREIDTETMKRARFIVDDIGQTFEEKGEFLIPLGEGAIGESHIIGDLGAVLAGTVEGRRSPDELTLFGSGGTALEFVSVAALFAEAAEAAGVGTVLG
ncbi:MAG: hypothetical protein R3E87_21500 [Burkholderiaceae bacterium]